VFNLLDWDQAGPDERLDAALSISTKYPALEFRRMALVEPGVREIAVFFHKRLDAEFVLVPGVLRYGSASGAEIAPFLMAMEVISPRDWDATSGRIRRGELVREGLSWVDAARFCMTAQVDLPTELEWEHAIRGGSRTPTTAGLSFGIVGLGQGRLEFTRTTAEEAESIVVVLRGYVTSDRWLGQRAVGMPHVSIPDGAVRPIIHVLGPLPFPRK
jgi:hypothetical protein